VFFSFLKIVGAGKILFFRLLYIGGPKYFYDMLDGEDIVPVYTTLSKGYSTPMPIKYLAR